MISSTYSLAGQLLYYPTTLIPWTTFPSLSQYLGRWAHLQTLQVRRQCHPGSQFTTSNAFVKTHLYQTILMFFFCFFLESGALNRSQPVKVSRPLPIQPAPIHPDLLIQPSSVTQAPLERKSFLTKEWTIPDRPKPGRKPKEVLNTVPN